MIGVTGGHQVWPEGGSKVDAAWRLGSEFFFGRDLPVIFQRRRCSVAWEHIYVSRGMCPLHLGGRRTAVGSAGRPEKASEDWLPTCKSDFSPRHREIWVAWPTGADHGARKGVGDGLW